MSGKINTNTDLSSTLTYQIRIAGHLSGQWTEWFDGLTIILEENGNTLLTGSVVDQAALHRFLKKIRNLGMPLLSVNRVEHNHLTKKEDRMNSTQKTARQAGALYFLFAIVAIFNEFVFPAFFVPGDAAATARNITTAESVYRFGIFASFANHIIFIVLVATLYHLLNHVDKKQAMLMVLFVSMGVTIELVNLLNKIEPLILLSGADYLSVFTKSQLESLSLGFLRLHGNGAIIASVFWGLWLFPFGILVIKSGLFPRILGFLLMVAGFAYVISGFTSIALPAFKQVVSQIMTPFYFGELPIIFWLMIKGSKDQPL